MSNMRALDDCIHISGVLPCLHINGVLPCLGQPSEVCGRSCEGEIGLSCNIVAWKQFSAVVTVVFHFMFSGSVSCIVIIVSPCWDLRLTVVFVVYFNNYFSVAQTM
jgi:hypothetical protein